MIIVNKWMMDGGYLYVVRYTPYMGEQFRLLIFSRNYWLRRLLFYLSTLFIRLFIAIVCPVCMYREITKLKENAMNDRYAVDIWKTFLIQQLLKFIWRQTRRQILHRRAPRGTLGTPQRQLEYPAVLEKVVRDPVLRPGLPVPRRVLDVDVLVRRVEVERADGGDFPRDAVADADLGEERRREEVHVLSRDGPDA